MCCVLNFAQDFHKRQGAEELQSAASRGAVRTARGVCLHLRPLMGFIGHVHFCGVRPPPAIFPVVLNLLKC